MANSFFNVAAGDSFDVLLLVSDFSAFLAFTGSLQEGLGMYSFADTGTVGAKLNANLELTYNIDMVEAYSLWAPEYVDALRTIAQSALHNFTS